ncbi:hypothetical protein B0T22DRAFT_13830 [Podospora appendiculata]|uniref:Uncharacterized protein n=1 Tax=Podospora appendiculata TaxID=314037 RepID=A0AAE1CFG1_9PEZI|nr:hypothetical protein B0T22DRAFT_13830 [Podospora appendiculata]
MRPLAPRKLRSTTPSRRDAGCASRGLSLSFLSTAWLSSISHSEPTTRVVQPRRRLERRPMRVDQWHTGYSSVPRPGSLPNLANPGLRVNVLSQEGFSYCKGSSPCSIPPMQPQVGLSQGSDGRKDAMTSNPLHGSHATLPMGYRLPFLIHQHRSSTVGINTPLSFQFSVCLSLA